MLLIGQSRVFWSQNRNLPSGHIEGRGFAGNARKTDGSAVRRPFITVCNGPINLTCNGLGYRPRCRGGHHKAPFRLFSRLSSNVFR